MSKYSFDGNYIYYPGSTIPINNHNIRDIEILDEINRTLLFQSYRKFHKQLNEKTSFNQEYLINLHRLTFQKIYPFAGKYRNVNVSKGDSVFCFAVNIKSQMDRLFAELNEEQYLKYSRDLTREEFAHRLAYYSCELIAIHPFFEFNGRIIRMFIDMIVTYNGFEYIKYPDLIDKDENAYIEASIDCMYGEYCKMYKLILNGLEVEKSE